MSKQAFVAFVACSLVIAACAGPKGTDGQQGPEGPPGPKGDLGPGFTTPPSVSAVTPSRLAVGLRTDVSIAGFATKWTQAATVSFGAGITVSDVRVGSSTGLVATIVVAPEATPGTRDVVVTEGGQASTFAGVFTVLPLFDSKLVGTASRGGYWFFDVRANDPDFAFPTDAQASVGPAPVTGKVTAEITVRQPRRLVVRVHSDFLADMAKYTVTLSFNAGKDSVSLTPFQLADKVESTLGDAAPLTGTLDAFETKLIKYTAAATPVEVVLHASAGLGSRPQLIVLDATGMPKSTSGSMGAPGPGNDVVITGDTYLALSEVAGAPNTAFTLSAVSGVSAIAEIEPNDMSSMAQPLTLAALGSDQGVRVTGDVSDSGESDWYKITVTAADVGKRIHLRSYTHDYIWFDATILQPDGTRFAYASVSNITLDLYSPVITAAGDFSIEWVGDDTGAHDFIISLQ